MLISHHIHTFRQMIGSLPENRELNREDLLTENFLMYQSGRLEMFYAPHNEYLNPAAKIMVVGLTPGWTQMSTAIQEARKAALEDSSDEDLCRRAKEAASFAGPMRMNLIQMLDALELPRLLNISTSGELFERKRLLLHTTSLLRFPLFVDKKNYNGAHPGLLTRPFLKETALSSVSEELELLKGALVIPLGTRVEQILQLAVQAGSLDPEQCLWGFPHPSGANGHRHKQFAARQEAMKERMMQQKIKGNRE